MAEDHEPPCALQCDRMPLRCNAVPSAVIFGLAYTFILLAYLIVLAIGCYLVKPSAMTLK